MECTNAFYVLAVLHLVHLTGGTRMNIWGLQRWCRLIDGSLILELVPFCVHFSYVNICNLNLTSCYSCRIHMALRGKRNYRMSWACTDVTQSLTVRCYLILWTPSLLSAFSSLSLHNLCRDHVTIRLQNLSQRSQPRCCYSQAQAGARCWIVGWGSIVYVG